MSEPDFTDWRSLDDWSKARLRWRLETTVPDLRPNQLVPGGDWRIAFWMAGRGFGKTRVGAEGVSDYARTHPGDRIAGVAETFADGRDVMVEGESGLLACVPPSCVEDWNRSLGELIFTNGARFNIYSSERPDSLRGPQHHYAWGDEPGKWKHAQDVWDMLAFGLRLGHDPRVLLTGTPKPTTLVRELAHRDGTIVIPGSTFDNAANLAPPFLEEIRRRYEGKRIGQQEVYGILLEDYEGALWRRAWIDEGRVTAIPGNLVRAAVGIDPSTWDPDLGDDPGTIAQGFETGIVVVAIDDQHPAHLWVIEDASQRGTQQEWAKAAIAAYRRIEKVCPVVMVPETNIGPSSFSTIRALDGTIKFYRKGERLGVRAAVGKRARAEPVSALYEPPHRVHHVGTFGELEGQLVGWDPTDNWSPDRLDALVWACTALAPEANREMTVSSAAAARI